MLYMMKQKRVLAGELDSRSSPNVSGAYNRIANEGFPSAVKTKKFPLCFPFVFPFSDCNGIP